VSVRRAADGRYRGGLVGMIRRNSVRHAYLPRASLRARFASAAFAPVFALQMAWTAAIAEPQEPIEPLPQTVAVDSVRAAIGERLFHDRRLSHDNRRSCATCHSLDQSGAEQSSRAIGANGELLRNTPTIFNVAFNLFCNWDGAANTLRAHTEKVLLSPNVMNTAWPELLAKLRADAGYTAAFRAAYRQEINRANVLDAVASFEQSLVTPNSRFDRYLRGERDALTAAQQKGYELFKSYGCAACHQGVNIGGNLFQKFGVFQVPEAAQPSAGAVDLGRYDVTGVSRDREVFRVPSLRNVAVTAPYFHDGRAATLEVAVDTMAKVQLGMQLGRDEVGWIVQFLRTLTGEWRGRPLRAATQ
jgi:cytochrome c peroxidase